MELNKNRKVSRQSKFIKKRIIDAWIFLIPMLIVLSLVAGYPLLRTIWFSFTDAELADFRSINFIGLENYLSSYRDEWTGVLADPSWWNAVYNTLFFTVVSVSLELLFGMIIALILNVSFRGTGLVRALVLVPWAIPTVVSAKMWSWMFHDQFGIINDILIKLGFLNTPIAWAADPSWAMISVIIVDVWKTTPFMTLLLLAALQMIPKDYYDAAKVDGVHSVKVFFRITVPLMAPAIMVAVIFRALDALRIFDLIYVLTANNSHTMTMSVYAREQLIDFQNVGLGSAASTLLFIIVALIVIIYLYLGRKKVFMDA